LILPPIAQEGGGFDFIWFLLPLICCMVAMSQRGEKQPAGMRAEGSESWYTTGDIQSTYNQIEEEVMRWREDAMSQEAADTSIMTRLQRIISSRRETRFGVSESKPPRLYTLTDRTGPIYFELTEVESGGTVVKATYSPELKNRMARFKADLPLKIPTVPLGLHCPACGKGVLPEFELCPYCGETLIKE
jgi:hypothetical protein